MIGTLPLSLYISHIKNKTKKNIEIKLKMLYIFQNCKKSKAELELMVKNVQDGDTSEIHDNIEFYNDNIQGITNELDMLKGE